MTRKQKVDPIALFETTANAYQRLLQAARPRLAKTMQITNAALVHSLKQHSISKTSLIELWRQIHAMQIILAFSEERPSEAKEILQQIPEADQKIVLDHVKLVGPSLGIEVKF